MSDQSAEHRRFDGPTIVDVLQNRAILHPNRTAYIFLQQGQYDAITISYGDLDRRARAVATVLNSLGKPGQRAMILLPSGLDYIVSFFGCLYAGAIAIPGFPQSFGRQRNREMWFRSVLADADPNVIFVTTSVASQLANASFDCADISKRHVIDVNQVDQSLASVWRQKAIGEESLAFLQYTSGSTSLPKGVMVTHKNILCNQRAIRAAYSNDQDSTIVGWLPLHHDMGLVGTVLQPAFLGAKAVLMPPTSFLQNPVLWLRAISDYRGRSSSAPNFAYNLCVKKISRDATASLDLSSWQIAVNGAEPVRKDTMQAFSDAFSDCGFRLTSFYPSYGLAESTLLVTGSRMTSLPTVRNISAVALEQNVVRDPSANEVARSVVACGRTVPETEVVIVDPATLRPCAAERIGEIWVRGPSVAQGYWNRPTETAETFRAILHSTAQVSFLRTGDLGFISDEQLTVTGRLKDLLIVDGRNIYPEDVEVTVHECDPALRSGCAAAFVTQAEPHEIVAVVSEVEGETATDFESLITKIRHAVVVQHGVLLGAITLVKRGTIPRTTSGKIRRSVCRDHFLSGHLDILAGRTFGSEWDDGSPVDETLARWSAFQGTLQLGEDDFNSYLQNELARVLGVERDRLPIDQPLVDLGLDSLKAVNLKILIEERLGVRLNLIDLVGGSSISDIVTQVREQRSQERSPSLKPNSSNRGPLSYGQRGLWVETQSASESALYTLAYAATVKNRLDSDALRRSFRHVLCRHSALRTVFRTEAGEPIQLVREIDDLVFQRHFEEIEISSVQFERLTDFVAAEATRPFAIADHPPIRLSLFSLPSGAQILAIACHHMIADLWSIEIIVHELGQFYGREQRNTAVSRLQPADSSYLKFAHRQLSDVEDGRLDCSLSYWLQQLSGELPVLDLPTDRPRSLSQPQRWAGEMIDLTPKIYSRLLERTRGSSVTPFMVLVAAFQLLLHRISGQDDLLLGVPTNGRLHMEDVDVVGYCVNPVVLRSHYDGNLTFTEYLSSTRRTVLEALRHQDYPFAALVEKLKPRRASGGAPFFQAMLVWQRAHSGSDEALASMALGIGGAKFSLGGVELESIPLPVSGSSADLTLMMAEDRGQLSGVLKYNATLFDSVTISRITSQFSSLLEVLATEREQKLSALPVSPAVDIQNMSTKRTTTVPIPSSNGPCIHQLVERMASEIPECPALIVNEQKITYAELNKRANRFARYLLKCGIQTESRVGIYLNRSVELIVAVLAIWKAGGAYVPFDTRDPRGRLAGLLARSAPEILITHDDLLQRLPDDLPTVILLNSDLDIIDQEADSNPNLSVSSANLAYIIHTSGSVGEPKGVLIEHRSVLNLLSGLKSRIYSNFDDRQLVVGLNASVAFDSSVKQLLVLGLGHTLCLVPEAARRSGDDLLRVAVSAGVDVLDCTPSQAELLIEAGLGVISSSLHLLLGGEPVTEAVWRELAKHESATCYNLYGPTECTVDTTICPIRANGPPSIGRPIDGVRVYLLDGDYQQVPDGIAGELFISGESVGRGYLGQPALTAARFLPDPFSPCGRMYRTGDIGRYSSNGTIRLIGRVDRQIKLRGFRIELDEVEAALKRIRGVRDAAVITWKAPNKTTHLIGYVVCDEERTSDQYKRLLSQMLPEYMIPVTMIHVTGIPLTSRAKRDYKALPIPDIARDEHSDDYAKPTSALEQELAALWVEQLQIDTISVDDSFFALGGDSLQAARLIGRIQQKYATDAPLLAQFFEEPTIAGLARAIALSGDSLMDNVHTNAD